VDKVRDFARELRENWDDHYWWARHQALQAALVALVVGAIGLLFTYLEARVRLSAHLKEATTP
jgi:hypothetical protein